MNKSKKTEPAAHIDQEFFDAFNPLFEFQIRGHTICGRALDIGGFEELKQKFKDWQGFDIAWLINKHEFSALLEICWIGVRECNKELIKSRDHLRVMVNTLTFNDWAPAWRQMAGLPPAPDNDDVVSDAIENQKKKESSETGDTSSP